MHKKFSFLFSSHRRFFEGSNIWKQTEMEAIDVGVIHPGYRFVGRLKTISHVFVDGSSQNYFFPFFSVHSLHTQWIHLLCHYYCLSSIRSGGVVWYGWWSRVCGTCTVDRKITASLRSDSEVFFSEIFIFIGLQGSVEQKYWMGDANACLRNDYGRSKSPGKEFSLWCLSGQSEKLALFIQKHRHMKSHGMREFQFTSWSI